MMRVWEQGGQVGIIEYRRSLFEISDVFGIELRILSWIQPTFISHFSKQLSSDLPRLKTIRNPGLYRWNDAIL